MYSKRYLIVTLLSLVISFLLYGNSIPGAFVYDDNFFAQRQDIRTPSIFWNAFKQPYNPGSKESGGGFYRPVWIVSLAANYIFFGDSPVSFHMVNILLYAGTLVFLFYILERLLKSSILAASIVLLFATLPIHTEVVANIKSRDELLSLFLLLASFIAFIRAVYSKARNPQTIISALLYGLALLTKESVVLGPLIFILVYRLEYKSSMSYMGKFILPYVFVLLLCLGLRATVLRDDAFLKDQAPYILNPLKGASLPVQLSTAMKIAGIYLTKTALPYNLTASYDFNHIALVSHPFASWESILGMIGLFVLCYLALRSKERTLRIGSIWFLVSYVIVSKIFFTKGALMGERLLYAPSVGLSVLYGYGLYRICQTRLAILIPVLTVLLAIYASIILPRNLVWRTSQGFFEQMVKDSPQSAQANISLARGYFDLGKLPDAKKYAIRAYTIYPMHPPTLVLLGKLSYIENDFTSCQQYTQKAISQEKTLYDANHFHLLCLAKLGKYQEAIDLASKRLKIAPKDEKIRFVVAVSLYKLGKRDDAMLEKYNWAKDLSASDREKILNEF